MLVYKPYQAADGPNPKLGTPWKGPFIIKAKKVSPVVYRLRTARDTNGTSIRLARLKPYFRRNEMSLPRFEEIGHLVLTERSPTPAVDPPELAKPKIGQYTVDRIGSHRPGVGRPRPHRVVHRLHFLGHGSESDLMGKVPDFPQCPRHNRRISTVSRARPYDSTYPASP